MTVISTYMNDISGVPQVLHHIGTLSRKLVLLRLELAVDDPCLNEGGLQVLHGYLYRQACRRGLLEPGMSREL